MLQSKKMIYISLIVLVIGCIVVWRYLFQGIDSKIKNDIESGNSVILLFSAEWCSSCIRQKPIYEEVKKEFPNINFYLVSSDLDKLQQKVLFKLHNIKGLPSLFKDGIEQNRLIGLKTKEELKLNFSKINNK
jgi:thiol-disulfide isomerase/thioredoxin